MKSLIQIKCEMQLKSSRYLDGLSLEEGHKPMCPLAVNDTEERQKISESFGIQLNKSPDIRDIPSYFYIRMAFHDGKVKDAMLQAAGLEVKTRMVGTLHSTYHRLLQVNIPIHKHIGNIIVLQATLLKTML
jgi:hypothetical protein